MKTLFLSAFLTMLLSLMACTTQSESGNLSAEDLESKAISEFAALPAFTTSATDLTSADTDGLLLMREEEKMAHDVYVTFYDAYKLLVFNNISKSELRHEDAVLSLINYYGLTDPAIDEVGKFASTEIQSLYDQLIAQGTSAVEALKAGAFIEERDLSDLKNLIEATEMLDIQYVYSNLMKGSEAHLRAFVRNLKVRGIVYTPQVLSLEDYNTILAGGSIAPTVEKTVTCMMR